MVKPDFKFQVFKLLTQNGLHNSLSFSRDQARMKTNTDEELRDALEFIDSLKIAIQDVVDSYDTD